MQGSTKKSDVIVHSTSKVEPFPPLNGPYLRLRDGKKRMVR